MNRKKRRSQGWDRLFEYTGEEYEWEKNRGKKPTGEQDSPQETDDETTKTAAIGPTIDDCTVYRFFMYYRSGVFM